MTTDFRYRDHNRSRLRLNIRNIRHEHPKWSWATERTQSKGGWKYAGARVLFAGTEFEMVAKVVILNGTVWHWINDAWISQGGYANWKGEPQPTSKCAEFLAAYRRLVEAERIEDEATTMLQSPEPSDQALANFIVAARAAAQELSRA
jgi:hypothetical protein